MEPALAVVEPPKDASKPSLAVHAAWLTRSTAEAIGIVLMAIVAVHFMLATLPGSAADVFDDPVLRETMRTQWGLDQPYMQQLGAYLYDIGTGNLRRSLTYRPGAEVVSIISGPLQSSLGMVTTAMLLSLSISLGLSLTVSSARTTWVRIALWPISILPVFLMARLTIDGVNAATWWLLGNGWIDRPEWFALPIEPHPLRWAIAVTILAVASSALSDVHEAFYQAITRIRRTEYIRAARARGMPTTGMILRNLLGPASAITLARFGFFLGGTVIIEQVMLMNGIGALLWRAVEVRDFPLVLGIVIVLAVCVSLVGLLAKAIGYVADPKLRASK